MLYDKKEHKTLCPNNRLLDLVKYALNFQVHLSNEDDNMTIPRNISLLKDVVDAKVIKKFTAQKLDGQVITFPKKLNLQKMNDIFMEDSLEKGKATMREWGGKGPYDYEEEPEAQTIDLDQRDFYSTAKLKNKNLRSRINKVDTIRGVSYKHDGKIDVGASIDVFSKNLNDLQKSPFAKDAKRRNSGISTQSMMRLESYRSIQHEPSVISKSELASQANKGRFSSPIQKLQSEENFKKQNDKSEAQEIKQIR